MFPFVGAFVTSDRWLPYLGDTEGDSWRRARGILIYKGKRYCIVVTEDMKVRYCWPEHLGRPRKEVALTIEELLSHPDEMVRHYVKKYWEAIERV